MSEKNPIYNRHTYSYLSLRQAIGWIGLLMPLVLPVSGLVLFSSEHAIIQESISHYYHTPARDFLVGALCAVALFFFFYTGYDRSDNWSTNVAAVFALGVAFFPTSEGANDWVGNVHLFCAAAFLLTLTFISLVLFPKTDQEVPSKMKNFRNAIYKACGVGMLLCLLLVGFFIYISDEDAESTFTFWGEAVALVLFGISWLVKGEFILGDLDSAQ